MQKTGYIIDMSGRFNVTEITGEHKLSFTTDRRARSV